MKCPNGHDPQFARNSIPGHVVLICRCCALMRLESLGGWIPAPGGLARLEALAQSTQQKAKTDRRDERTRQLRETIVGMEFE
jgi:hypothetical protein